MIFYLYIHIYGTLYNVFFSLLIPDFTFMQYSRSRFKLRIKTLLTTTILILHFFGMQQVKNCIYKTFYTIFNFLYLIILEEC